MPLSPRKHTRRHREMLPKRPTDLIGAGGLVGAVLVSEVSVRLRVLGLGGDAGSGLIHRRHVVAQRNGLHCFVHSAADTFSNFGS